MQTSEHPSFLNRRGARFRSATICSTALVLFLFASGPAFADEIDDLKVQVEQLMKRIEAIEAKAKAAPAAPAVTSGNDKVKLAVSGQVNRVSFL